MYISTNDWLNYINKLSKLNKSAADAIVAYVQKNGFSDTDALISYANAVVQTYGSGSAALAAAMYDATAEAAGYFYDPAEPAALPGYGEIAKTVKGTLKTSQNVNELAGAVSRLVKRAGADTTLQNAYRDRPRKKYGKKRNTGAQIAWVPHGDTCPFCLMLASNGWRNQTVGGAQNHAEHIHSNCDCTYAVRFDDHSGVQGYDPDVYKDMYDNAEGDTWKEKVNSMRRAQYEKDKDRINAQKRAAYALRNKEKTSDIAINDVDKSLPNGRIKLRLNYFDKADSLYLESFSIEEEKGFEDVCGHGNSKQFEVSENGVKKVMSAQQFADFIVKNGDYKGQDLRFVSCSVGEGDDSFAQELSKILGNKVKAPNMDAYYAPEEGIVFIGSPYRNIGKWRTFEKGVELE